MVLVGVVGKGEADVMRELETSSLEDVQMRQRKMRLARPSYLLPFYLRKPKFFLGSVSLSPSRARFSRGCRALRPRPGERRPCSASRFPARGRPRACACV